MADPVRMTVNLRSITCERCGEMMPLDEKGDVGPFKQKHDGHGRITLKGDVDGLVGIFEATLTLDTATTARGECADHGDPLPCQWCVSEQEEFEDGAETAKQLRELDEKRRRDE